MALSKPSSSKPVYTPGMARGAKLAALLVDEGTALVRKILEDGVKKMNPPSLREQLKKHERYLCGLPYLNPGQKKTLYPDRGDVPDTAQGFDISLLELLLKELVCYELRRYAPYSRERDRLRRFRNDNYGHRPSTDLSEADFDKLWNELTGILVALGGDRDKISKRRSSSIDPEQERKYFELLERQHKEDLILAQLESLRKGQDKGLDQRNSLLTGQEKLLAQGERQGNSLKRGQDCLSETLVTQRKIQKIGQEEILDGQQSLKKGQEEIKSLLEEVRDAQSPGTNSGQREDSRPRTEHVCDYLRPNPEESVKPSAESSCQTDQDTDAEKVMKMIHNSLLKNNREKIAEKISDEQTLSKLVEAMSSEKVVLEEQLKTVKGVDKLVDVLEEADPEKYLVFVDILQREGYSELVKLLDPRGLYPDSVTVRHISNLSGVVDHYSVTKKELEVKDSLESGRGVILHGMPGSGKTQLAYKLAGDYAKVHPHSVVWVIDGSSEKKLKDGITNLQQRLGGESNVDISQFQSIVSRWKHSLLLINDLSPQVAIPTQVLSSSAKMIVTTQDSLMEYEDIANIPIEGFTEDEAVEFLSPKMPTGTTEEQMRDLANLFSRLPLGLAAARASIHRGNMTVEEYKQQLQGGREALEVLMRREDNWLQKHYKKEHHEAARNIFAALQLAIDNLDDPCNPGEEKKCKVMLQLCAFLEPNNIPVLILKSALESSPATGADAYFTERMRMYSLGSIEGAGVKRRLSIHGVTQMALRLHMDQEQQTTHCINKLLQVLVKFFVKDATYSEAHKFSLELMPHVDAVLMHGNELQLGPEYPLMKARLLMVYGHLIMQMKRAPRLSISIMDRLKKDLERFADIPANYRNDYSDSTMKELYKLLADKSQSLEDGFFQETVLRRIITKQQLSAVSDKLGAEHSTTHRLRNMMDNFEPLTVEMYNTLVDNNLAVPVEKLKRMFLPELYISILYMLGTSKLESVDAFFGQFVLGSAVVMCTEVTKETGVSVLDGFLADSELRSIPTYEENMFHEFLSLLVPAAWSSSTLSFLMSQKTYDLASAQYYDVGLLTSLDDDTFFELNSYKNALMNCIQAVQHSKEGQKKLYYTSMGQEACKKMLELVESKSQAGNPPLRRAEYYIKAGVFSTVVEELEKAAKMFLKAYRVELKRGNYHPRIGEALLGLIQVRFKQKELRRARVCARRFLQLAEDHWPKEVPNAEEDLRKVCCKIAFQARKENKEKEKSVCGNVTTV